MCVREMDGKLKEMLYEESSERKRNEMCRGRSGWNNNCEHKRCVSLIILVDTELNIHNDLKIKKRQKALEQSIGRKRACVSVWKNGRAQSSEQVNDGNESPLSSNH